MVYTCINPSYHRTQPPLILLYIFSHVPRIKITFQSFDLNSYFISIFTIILSIIISIIITIVFFGLAILISSIIMTAHTHFTNLITYICFQIVHLKLKRLNLELKLWDTLHVEVLGRDYVHLGDTFCHCLRWFCNLVLNNWCR